MLQTTHAATTLTRMPGWRWRTATPTTPQITKQDLEQAEQTTIRTMNEKKISMQYEIEKYIFGKEKCCFHEIALTKLIFVSIDGLFRFEKWAQSDVQLSTACCEQ